MSRKQTEKRAVVIKIGKGNNIARKTMSHCARVTRRKKGKQSCKYNKNNVVTLGNFRIHVVCLEENLGSDGWTSGPSSDFGREASGSLPELSWVGICSGWVWLGISMGWV